jgi:hypothetical protein
MPKETMTFTQKVLKWWHTDCAFCRRSRLIVIWGILMLVFYLYVWN